MDQPTSPDRSADSDFSFLMAVLVAALMAVHTQIGRASCRERV